MQWLTFRFGLMAGMGKHCPIRRIKRLALPVLLAAATLFGAITAALNAHDTAAQLSEAQAGHGAMMAELAEVKRDREDALAILSSKAAPVDILANGTRIYTRVKSYEERIKPVMVAAQ